MTPTLQRVTGLVVAVAWLACAAPANAATYFVANNGRNANSGAQAAPFRTISYAAGRARPGDVINVRGGVYYAQELVSSKGLPSARITFRSFPGETAVIDGVATPAGTDLVIFENAAYVDFTGFEVRNAKRIAISAWGTTGLRITRNHIHHATRNGIYTGSPDAGRSRDIAVEENDVHDTVLENRTHPMRKGGWAGAVAISNTDGGRAFRNRVHHNFGEGIIAGLSNDITIEQNEAFDNFSANIYLDNARRVLVNRNFVYNTGDQSVYRFGFPPIGIAAANEKWPRPNPLRDITVTNNIVVNTRWGFYYGAYEAGGGLKNTTVANNTFYRAAVALIAVERGAHSNAAVTNNIFSGPSRAMAAIEGGGVSFRNNDWFGGPAGRASGPGDVTANPMLAQPGGTRAEDYRLLPGSPAVGRGVPVAAVTSDFFGAPRNARLDLGAHQLSGRVGAAAPARSTKDEGLVGRIKRLFTEAKQSIALMLE